MDSSCDCLPFLVNSEVSRHEEGYFYLSDSDEEYFHPYKDPNPTGKAARKSPKIQLDKKTRELILEIKMSDSDETVRPTSMSPRSPRSPREPLVWTDEDVAEPGQGEYEQTDDDAKGNTVYLGPLLSSPSMATAGLVPAENTKVTTPVEKMIWGPSTKVHTSAEVARIINEWKTEFGTIVFKTDHNALAMPNDLKVPAETTLAQASALEAGGERGGEGDGEVAVQGEGEGKGEVEAEGTTTQPGRSFRVPPPTPPENLIHHALSIPTLPSMHRISDATLVEQYRLQRNQDAALFDNETRVIKDSLIAAKVSRGGRARLLKNEYSVELASREDAAMAERWASARRDAETQETPLPGLIEKLQALLQERADNDHNDDVGDTAEVTAARRELKQRIEALPVGSIKVVTEHGTLCHQRVVKRKVTEQGERIVAKTWVEITEVMETPRTGKVKMRDLMEALDEDKEAGEKASVGEKPAAAAAAAGWYIAKK